ncbi:unnamed protein product [Linum trigynum]|uniref:Uncharacterized protein n=1 Tax=Linum trigynum TaxID=586398 RepID=A0AAV2F1N1_9ROSI
MRQLVSEPGYEAMSTEWLSRDDLNRLIRLTESALSCCGRFVAACDRATASVALTTPSPPVPTSIVPPLPPFEAPHDAVSHATIKVDWSRSITPTITLEAPSTWLPTPRPPPKVIRPPPPPVGTLTLEGITLGMTTTPTSCIDICLKGGRRFYLRKKRKKRRKAAAESAWEPLRPREEGLVVLGISQGGLTAAHELTALRMGNDEQPYAGSSANEPWPAKYLSENVGSSLVSKNGSMGQDRESLRVGGEEDKPLQSSDITTTAATTINVPVAETPTKPANLVESSLTVITATWYILPVPPSFRMGSNLVPEPALASASAAVPSLFPPPITRIGKSTHSHVKESQPGMATWFGSNRATDLRGVEDGELRLWQSTTGIIREVELYGCAAGLTKATTSTWICSTTVRQHVVARGGSNSMASSLIQGSIGPSMRGLAGGLLYGVNPASSEVGRVVDLGSHRQVAIFNEGQPIVLSNSTPVTLRIPPFGQVTIDLPRKELQGKELKRDVRLK